LNAIRALASDPRNCVLVITGLTKLKLGDLFTDIPNITIATSNGLVYSWGANLLTYEEMDKIAASAKLQDPMANSTPVSMSSNNQNSNSNNSLLKLTMKDINDVSSRWWDSLHFDVDWEAVRDIALPIITKFTFRTNGTCQTPRLAKFYLYLCLVSNVW
jgi:trehalose-6-phosphatase